MAWSPNRSPRGTWKPEFIVVHVTDGGGSGAHTWMMDDRSEVSAHFLVYEDGRIEQLVPLSNAAWHCGTVRNPTKIGAPLLHPGANPNLYSIGIEFAGKGNQTTWPEPQLRAGGTLLQLLGYPKLPVLLHRDIRSNKTCPGTLPITRLLEMAEEAS